MKLINEIIYRVPFYPFLLSVYPVLFLWQENSTQTPVYVLPRSILLSTVIFIIVFGISLLIFRNLRKSAVIAGLILILFFFYGHLFNIIHDVKIFGIGIGEHRNILRLWGIIFLTGFILILRVKSDLRNFTLIANIVSIFLVTLPLSSLMYLMISSVTNVKAINHGYIQNTTVNSPKRDVYYFLLDSYPRQDFLKETFDLDNQEFLSMLDGLGFVIPNCTQSNYDNTIFSMTATLNMDYLDQMGFSYPKFAASPDENGYKSTLAPTLQANRVMQLFREAGYKIITFRTPYPFVNFQDSDIIFDVEASTGIFDKTESLSFQYWLLQTTVMSPLMDNLELRPELLDQIPPLLLQFIDPRDEANSNRNFKQYQQNLFALENLDNISKLPGRKFVYAHLLTTHPPFTFYPDGSFLNKYVEYDQAFKDQVSYTNQRLYIFLKSILSQSQDPPIIIIQGDHALPYGHTTYFRILNAYFLPDKQGKLYPTITPVNSFRLIFSEYFNQDFPLLSDQSILIDRKYQNGFTIMPQTCVP